MEVSDRSVWLTPMHYGETGCTMVKLNVSSKDACINKSQTVLVDSCWYTSFSNRLWRQCDYIVYDYRWQVTGKVCTAPRQDGPTSQDRSECKVCCLNLLDTLEPILNVRAVTARVWKTPSHDWLISCERVARDKLKSQFYLSFWRSNLISCETVHRKHEIAILPQFLTIEPHFVRKGCAGQVDIAILPQFLTIEPHFVRKGLRGTSWNRNFTAVFGDRTSFSCERVARDKLKSQFYRSFWRSNLISCERVAFRAVSLPLPISWISKMWLCRSMMVTCLHGARLSDSSGWNGPLNPLNVKIPLQLELKPWQNLLSRTLRRHQNEIVVMPSKIVGKWRRMKW